MPITIDQLVDHYPRVYHVAEKGALDSIEAIGLLSTTAILDRLSIEGASRAEIELQPRRTTIELHDPEIGIFIVRDQKPLSASKLEKCLGDGISVEEWCSLLNRKVYFFLDRAQANKLLEAREYRDRSHFVLEFDTRSLASAYQSTVTLAAMNTGSTSPIGHPRGRDTIVGLDTYPYEDRLGRRLPIAKEFCVDYSVPDAMDHVVTLWEAQAEADWIES